MNSSSDIPGPGPVLIIGAGVNGCAVARELVLNDVPVTIVDTADIGNGATAKSSRLIHGGLRYLEYADIRLVRESLRERERLLTLAPQFVRPLRLHIPVEHRMGGLLQSGLRFLGLTRFGVGRALANLVNSDRGLYTVRFGLWLYDRIARSSLLPDHTVHRLGESAAPRVDPGTYRWVCSYSDAQMVYPERFLMALLEDARQHAEENGVDFQVLPYHRVELEGRTARVRRLLRDGSPLDPPVAKFEPSAIINATGAWGDLTLKTLGVRAERLFGGTKGSHIITRHAGLRGAIGDDGVYAESSDGRLVFILPFGPATLIGTTDLRFEGSPSDVVATEEEIDYLLEMVNSVVGGLELSRDDVAAHYCGVRPLPYVPSGKTGAIPRGHYCHTTDHAGVPLYTLIGGKLTTCRAFGEEVADRVLVTVGRTRRVPTRNRPIPGAGDPAMPPDEWIRTTVTETGQQEQTVRFLFNLMGTTAHGLLSRCPADDPHLSGPPVSSRMVEELIRTEWVTRLSDLVERRLALVFDGRVTMQTLQELADCLVRTGHLESHERDVEIADCCRTLERFYGIRFAAEDS